MVSKLIIIGGFLGAGKTTAILHMAGRFIKSGKKIGIVANDQGSQLVDAYFLRANGLDVLSVEGGCFCCNFNEFMRKAADIRQSKSVDIILAEPVGSCTDLVATIYKPILRNKTQLQSIHAEGFSLAPLSIVADPKRIKRLMMQEAEYNNGVGSFPNEVNYLFDKQLQEADVIAINKCDILPAEEIDRIFAFIQAKYPGAKVLRVSAKTGEGLDEWADLIFYGYTTADKSMQIDYGEYARAEAALGWLNGFYTLISDEPGDINARARTFMTEMKAAFGAQRAEIAHLKCYCVAQNEYYKASITGIGDELDEDAAMTLPHKEINLIVNARVHIEPDLLEKTCKSALNKAFRGFYVEDIQVEFFKPSPPNPTYRIS